MGKTLKPGSRWLWTIALCMAAGASGAKADEGLRIFNSSILKINYRVTDAMGGPMQRVVLWYRFNEGSWQEGANVKAGDPIEFIVPEDGIYEFSVRPEEDPPGASTDESSFRCLVDFNRPVVQILDVDYKNDTAIIQWAAFDRTFPDRPIEIYLLSGTASTFMGRFANGGSAVIALDAADLPARVKVVAVDRAGNYGVDISREISSPGRVGARAPHLTSRPVASAPKPPVTTTRAVAESRNPEALRELQLGKVCAAQGQWEQACIHLKRALQIDPNLASADLELADVLRGLDRYNEAVEFYLHALTLDGANVRARQGLALARIRQGQYLEAISHLAKVVEIEPGNVQGWLYLGDAYWMTGRRSEASSYWQKARGLVEKNEQFRTFEPAVHNRLKMAEER